MSSPKLSDCDAIIFDLDGTLWNSCEACALAWNKTLEQWGIKDQDVDAGIVASFSGLRINHILDQFFPSIPVSQQAGFLELYHQHERQQMEEIGGTLYPGIREALERLETRFALFIVSNCMAGYIENFLRLHQLEKFFRDFECPGNTGLSKAENIQLIIDRNHLARPVYIGDTVWDQEAASANNLPFVFVSYGFGKAIDPVYQVQNVLDLLELFAV